ncbi:hypothetical protein [Alteriqipengyuania sp.]|uniref:hypothetical protein n=1 Tax=Alteriqipengyuania sp. TaxID=2800692 RepID=UPI003559A8A1
MFLFGVFSVRPQSQAESALENSEVFGCYSAPGQDSILLNASGLSVAAQQFGPIDYRVLPGRLDYDFSVPSCPKVLSSEGKLHFAPAERGGICWFDLYNTAGGEFALEMSDLGVGGFRILGPYGFVRYTRNPASYCSIE